MNKGHDKIKWSLDRMRLVLSGIPQSTPRKDLIKYGEATVETLATLHEDAEERYLATTLYGPHTYTE